MLTIYNSLSKKKEEFKPIRPGEVKLYVCGMTVYDYCHIGHARTMMAFDLVNRYLRDQGYKVIYVRNVTDIDDKIIQRALDNGESTETLTQRFIKALEEDTQALGILAPDAEPKATDYVSEMIALIETLISEGLAYVGSTGDVYFDVLGFKSYGKLSHKNLEALHAGARIAIEEAKKTPLDFVLWKLSKPNEPTWSSPWGAGRPGWHTECVVMSRQALGQPFDIHGGGHDLKFPHHENEIAQAEGAYHQTFVNYWMHVGFVEVNQEKMSKSLHNFLTIRDALAKRKAEVLRYFLISSHYRSPVDYSMEALDGAESALDRLYGALRGLDLSNAAEHPIKSTEYENRFHAAMDDDFNTPEALAVLFDWAREINRIKSEDLSLAQALALRLKHKAAILGLLNDDPDHYFQNNSTQAIPLVEIERLIQDREQARSVKDWKKADEIRAELLTRKVIIEDGPTGTLWRYE